MVAKRRPENGERRRGRGDAIEEAVRYGIDVSMLRDNLAARRAEQLRRHAIALNTVKMLRKAKRV